MRQQIARVYTRDGEVHEYTVQSEEDGRWYDELPFTTCDVIRTSVTEAGRDSSWRTPR